MLNAFPIVGWVINLVVAMSVAFPLWLAWTVCGIGTHYFGFLPEQWQAPGYWATVGLFICAEIIGSLTLGRISVNSTTVAATCAERAAFEMKKIKLK